MTRTPISECQNCEARKESVFCGLDDKALTELSEHKVTNRYKKGQTLFFQGNPPFGIYCVKEGKIKISKVGNEGKESIIRVTSCGDILGHRSLFTDDYYSATATAMEDCVICFLDKKFILKAIQDHSSIAMNIIQRLSYDMGAAEKKVASLYQKNVRERVAELLLYLKDSYGVQEGDNWKLDIKLTREEMSSMIGMANETLIRLLSEFKEDDLIDQKGKTIFILKEKTLLDYANISY